VSLLDSLAATASDAVTAERVEAVVARAHDEAAGRTDPDAVDELALLREGRDTLLAHKGALVGLGRGAVGALLASLAAGDLGRALTMAEARTLTYHELLRASKGAAGQARATAEARRAQRAAASELSAAIGRYALTRLLPYLLAAL